MDLKKTENRKQRKCTGGLMRESGGQGNGA
jgi:hypothetical protein